MPELHEFSKNKNLFVVKPDADKSKIIEQFDKAITTTDNALRVDAGKIKIASKKAAYIEGFTINDALQNNMNKIFTNGSNKEVIGYTLKGSRKGVHVSKLSEKVYLIKWRLVLEDGKFSAEEFSQEINLN
ncbi:hypothetical protein [Mycoplasmopsis primatum]|uniref:hypothetical protein n=1 Tax=Mycoplasmopsis primatum TaxID=55604 RepID=UPI00049772CC|nr:hypothetical protein [Mycoplasmopsis primatum]